MVKTWVLLRGLTREQAHWGDFPATLARALPSTLPSARVLTVDLPGAGQLRHQACPWRVEQMVQACRQQLAVAGARPPYALLGLSLGGMVASAWARACPQELTALVLVNTSMRPYSPPARRLRAQLWPQLLRLLASDRHAEETILHLTSSRPERHAQALACWQALRESRPVSRANALRQLVAAACYRWSGPPPAVPVLLACSEHDALVDPECSRLIARAWSVPLRSHPDAGHDLPLDDGPWLARQIAEWCQAGGHGSLPPPLR